MAIDGYLKAERILFAVTQQKSRGIRVELGWVIGSNSSRAERGEGKSWFSIEHRGVRVSLFAVRGNRGCLYDCDD